jgi:hypothetical protein
MVEKGEEVLPTSGDSRHKLVPITAVVRYALMNDTGLSETQRQELLPTIVSTLVVGRSHASNDGIATDWLNLGSNI